MKLNKIILIMILCLSPLFSTNQINSPYRIKYVELQVPDVIPLGGEVNALFKCQVFGNLEDTVYYMISNLHGGVEISSSMDWTAQVNNEDTLSFPITITIPDNDTSGFFIWIGKSPILTHSSAYSFVTTGETGEFFNYDIIARTNMSNKNAISRDPYHPSRTQHGYQYPIERPEYVPGMYNKSEKDTTGRIARSRKQVMEDNPPTPEEKIQHLKEIGDLSMLQQALSLEDYTEYKSNYIVTQQKNDGINRYSEERVNVCDPPSQIENRVIVTNGNSSRIYGIDRTRVDTIELLNEGFESTTFPPDNWLVIDYQYYEEFELEWERIVASNKVHSGSYSAGVEYDSDNFIETELFSPIIDLSDPDIENVVLSFFRKELFIVDYCWHDIGIYIDGILEESYEIGTNLQDFWEEEIIDLSYYIGENSVEIGFFYSGMDSDNWYIDDILLEITTETPIYGCTDPWALNYNPNATIDDGSCEYDTPPGAGESCQTAFPYGTLDGHVEYGTLDAYLDDGAVWYSFTLTESSTVSISTCGSYVDVNTDTDTILLLYNVCGSGYIEYNDDSDECGDESWNSYMELVLPSGIYYVKVVLHEYQPFGPFNLYINAFSSSGGDTIEDPFVIDSGGFSFEATGSYNVSGTTTGFTHDYDEVCEWPNSTAPDVVYQLDLLEDNWTLDIDLCGSSYDTKVYVYDDSNPYQLMACNDDYDGCPDYTSRIENLELNSGTYYIIVDGYNISNGNYVLEITGDQSTPAYGNMTFGEIPDPYGELISAEFLMVSQLQDHYNGEPFYTHLANFISFSIINNGDLDINESFNVDLIVDATIVNTWVIYDLAIGDVHDIVWENIELTNPGPHTIEVVIDADELLTEIYEDDNSESQVFQWVDPEQITIQGTFIIHDYVLDNGYDPGAAIEMPGRQLGIFIMDANDEYGAEIASVVTDDFGFFSVTVDNVETDHTPLDIVIFVDAENTEAYAWDTEYYTDYDYIPSPHDNDVFYSEVIYNISDYSCDNISDGVCDVTEYISINNPEVEGKFFIIDRLLESRRRLTELTSLTPPNSKVAVGYPWDSPNGSSHYKSNGRRIFIVTDQTGLGHPDTYDEDVIYHEHMHDFEYTYEFLNNSTPNLGEEFDHYWCEIHANEYEIEDWRDLAAKESFGFIWSCIMKGSVEYLTFGYVQDTQGNETQAKYFTNLENGSWGSRYPGTSYPDIVDYPNTTEDHYECITGQILWDIYDTIGDDYDSDGISDIYDDSNMNNIFNTLTNKDIYTDGSYHHPYDIREFWDAWFTEPSSEGLHELWEVYSNLDQQPVEIGDLDNDDLIVAADIVILVAQIMNPISTSTNYFLGSPNNLGSEGSPIYPVQGIGDMVGDHKVTVLDVVRLVFQILGVGSRGYTSGDAYLNCSIETNGSEQFLNIRVANETEIEGIQLELDLAPFGYKIDNITSQPYSSNLTMGQSISSDSSSTKLLFYSSSLDYIEPSNYGSIAKIQIHEVGTTIPIDSLIITEMVFVNMDNSGNNIPSNYLSLSEMQSTVCQIDSLLCYGCTDLNAFNYNPVASILDNTCVFLLGDLNADTILNVLDIVLLNNIILGYVTPDEYQLFAGDVNSDGVLDILDILAIINLISMQRSGDDDGEGEILISKVLNLDGLQEGDDASMTINLYNEPNIEALLVTIDMEENYRLSSFILGERSSNMELQTRVFDDSTKLSFILYSTSGFEIEEGMGAIMEIGLHSLNLGRNSNPNDGNLNNIQFANSNEELLTYNIIPSDEMSGIINNGVLLSEVPTSFFLHAAFPNPFNPITTLKYDITENGQVSMIVYDMLGREVTQLVNTYKEAGYHTIQWDATSHASGVYIVKLVTRDFTATQKVALVK